jgi:hypothetical protein
MSNTVYLTKSRYRDLRRFLLSLPRFAGSRLPPRRNPTLGLSQSRGEAEALGRASPFSLIATVAMRVITGPRPVQEAIDEPRGRSQGRSNDGAPTGEQAHDRADRVGSASLGLGLPIARVTTQTLLDILEVPQNRRTASTCRLLSRLTAELGWTAVRVRDLSRGGYKEQVRGYCRAVGHQGYLA